MEAEALILPDNTIIDTTQPPPGFNFPKPDFSEIVQDDPTNDKSEAPLLKPTFKSALQAKKRLQAFSSARAGSLPSSPKKVKGAPPNEDKSDEGTPPIKKTPKKGHYHDDKAKAVIEEIEEIKRGEQAFLELQRFSLKRSRSRSRSADKGRFKKVEKKSRNYRRRSVSPEKPKRSPKKPKKYPRNWREFHEIGANFELNREFEVAAPTGNNELLRQVLFEAPSLPIAPFKMKTVNREDKVVPFEYVRYTRAKPVISYSANFGAIKESCLSKKIVMDTLPKDIVANMEKLYSNSVKFTTEEKDPKLKKSALWYPKVWKDAENECKILEKSVGLSFLQSYTGEEEENEFMDEEILPAEKPKPVAKSETKEERVGKEKSEKEEKFEKEKSEKKGKSEKEEKVEKGKSEKEEIVEDKAEKEKGKREKEEKIEKEKPEKDRSKKKRHKSKKEEAQNEEKNEDVEKKKKPKRTKEKKKHAEENLTESPLKKKKNKKDKLKKKEKRVREKKHKHKKPKEKKKKEKEKSHQEKDKVHQDEEQEKLEKLNKQKVIDELKEIEEKLAKKKEEKEKSEKKAEKEEKSRKRKLSEREDDAKKAKQDKHRRTSDENDVKIEHALKRKLEKAKKHELSYIKLPEKKPEAEKSDKHEDGKKEEHPKKSDHKKSKHSGDATKRKRKSRWSEPDFDNEELPNFENLKVIEEVPSKSEYVAVHEKTKKVEDFRREDMKLIEEIKETTPDTDEYHSHWESDDDISSSVPRHSLKLNRSWESDEELFERSHNRNKTIESYTNLEIPLNIKNFSRRSSNWDEKPRSVVDELKLLEEERRSLSEERRKLELEKQKILKLQEEAKLDLLEEKKEAFVEEPKPVARLRSSTPEEIVKVKKEKNDINDFSIDSLNNSLLSNVSSSESNFPIAALENEYEEFIKAVSSESSVSVTPKKKVERKNSTSSSWSSDSDHKKKKRKKKKKKKKKSRECEGLLLGKGNNIFNEFDIPVPSDLPEMVPTPVPVPSPILPLDTILPFTAPLLLNSIVDLQEKSAVEEPKLEPGLDLTKPFVFSSIVLPTKKTPLVDSSSFNLDDDSDSIDFTDKFVKKPEGKEAKTEEVEEQKKDDQDETIIIILDETPEIEEKPKIDEEPIIVIPPEIKIIKIEEVEIKKPEEQEKKKAPEPVPKPIEDILDVPLPPEKPPPKEPPIPEIKPSDHEKIKRSRSISPPRRPAPREKRRSRSRSRDRDLKRRSPIRRRELTPPRRRHLSPRRRSPPRRRGSPRRRSPSPRRRSPLLRRRRRSPSLSPPRSRGGARKRTPSPRRRSSPLNSPLDGFKRSVADSTISDDMLPQPNPDDYSESPPSYVGGSKYYDRKGSKRSSLSPQLSPKRISLDDRINQVLGLEKNEPPPPMALPPPPKPQETYPNYTYGNTYGPQYPQYTQYPQKNDYVQPFTPMMYTQPPPPIVKPVPTPTKVVQVGNILQVVPTEEIPPAVIENKIAERTQKIVQVGNMLQIVPAIMATIKPPVPEPQPVSKPVPIPEKQSAEAIMKQKNAERKAEREKRRQERERRRKEKEKKRKEKEKRKQMKLKLKTENMIKRAIQIEAEALANDDVEEEGENAEAPVQWPPVPVVVSTTPTCKGILLQGGSKQRKSVQFADGVRPGEGTSPSGGEELSSPPPHPRKLPKEKRYKKLKIPKKSKKKKVRVKVVKKVPILEEEEDDDDDDILPPPSPPPGSPPPHVFPSRVKTHTINNVHQYVGNIIQSTAPGFPYRPPMPMVINRHQPPPGYITGGYPSDVNTLSHPAYQGVPSHH